jgi:small-conductance mechanosensitive channel
MRGYPKMDNAQQIAQAQSSESRKIAQNRAIDLRLRKENRAFLEKATTVKKQAVRDPRTKALSKTLVQKKALNKELSKANELHQKEYNKRSEEFQKKIAKLEKEHGEVMDKFDKDFAKKQAPKRKLFEQLGTKCQKFQDELNNKYQECFITYAAEVRRILTPYVRVDKGVVLKNLPVDKTKLVLQVEKLQNSVDEFIINTETLNDEELSKAIDEFIE